MNDTNVYSKREAEQKIESMERKLRQARDLIQEALSFIDELGLADGPEDGESLNERVAQALRVIYPGSSRDFGTSMVGALDYLRESLLYTDEPENFEPWAGHLRSG